VASPSADPDNDHVPNQMEFALATDPLSPNSTSLFTGTIVANTFRLQFRRNILSTNLNLVVQATSALTGPWTDLMTYTSSGGWNANAPGATAAESTPFISYPDHFVLVQITDPSSVNATASRFFRIKVN
jgi:hypothetical protein